MLVIINSLNINEDGSVHISEIEPLLENITYILKLTADNYLPKIHFRRHLKPFWNHELTKLKKKAKCAWHQWVENGRQSDDIIKSTSKVKVFTVKK